MRRFIFTSRVAANAISISLVPQRAPFEWGDLVRYVAVLWIVLFALLIVLRGPDTRATRLLSLALVLQALETAAGQAFWPVPLRCCNQFDFGGSLLECRLCRSFGIRMAAFLGDIDVPPRGSSATCRTFFVFQPSRACGLIRNFRFRPGRAYSIAYRLHRFSYAVRLQHVQRPAPIVSALRGSFRRSAFFGPSGF